MSGKLTKSIDTDHFFLKKQRKISNILSIGIMLFAIIALTAVIGFVFDEEAGVFFKWYFTVMLVGIIFMPCTILLTGRFNDSGWIVSKVLGIAVSGWIMWFMSSVKIAKFSYGGCIASCIICLIGNFAILIFYIRKHHDNYRICTDTMETIRHILIAEFMFLFMFAMWMYLKGFSPKAYGTTEKLMDYGFMKAIDKSDYMPAEDIWFAGTPINYYYVGQFMTTYLSKLSGVTVEYGYNFSLMIIAAFAFSLPFSIVSSVASNSKVVRENRYKTWISAFPYISGAISGVAVTFAGNFHYCLFSGIVPKLRTVLGIDKMAAETGYSFSDYWFPDATRYIGYVPNVPDKTIHEFPSYSFILGDLHAHVINIMFVLCVIAILAGFILKLREECEKAVNEGVYFKFGFRKRWLGFTPGMIFDPSVILVGFFVGLFHTTNFWDFPIYFVVSGAIILFVNCIRFNFRLGAIVLTLIHAIEVLLISKFVALPFTMNFKMIASELKICENHSELYQLIILWGIPTLCLIAFFFVILNELKARNVFDMTSVDVETETVNNDIEKFDNNEPLKYISQKDDLSEPLKIEGKKNAKNESVKNGKKRNAKNDPLLNNENTGKKTKEITEPCGRYSYLFRFIARLDLADLFFLVLGLCALGLVILPEIVYVKDIYSGDYKRSNTMFKLTYQAYIMFGMMMGYVIPRFIIFAKKKGLRIFGIIMLLLLNWTVGYFETAVTSWFGDVSLNLNFGIVYAEGTKLPVDADEMKFAAMFAVHVVLMICILIALIILGMSKIKRCPNGAFVFVGVTASVFLISAMVVFGECYEPNSRYIGFDCGEYLLSVNPDDYYATNWINENIEGRPVMLEANGNSYSDYNRVSVRTGLPTVLGWRTHEWLWQSNSSTEVPEELKKREKDVEAIYTAPEAWYIESLLEDYNIQYIYVGDCEREKYGDALNEDMLRSLGTVCYESELDDGTQTYIIKVESTN